MKHSIFLILIILTGILFQTSCEKEKTNILDDVQFIEPSYFGVCFAGLYPQDQDEIVIRDNITYQKLGDSCRIFPVNLDCESESLPEMDFDQYSLIGKYSVGGGCSADYDRQVINDEDNKKYIYKINVNYSGLCEVLLTNMNWALVPKSPDDYTVEFQLTQNVK